MSRGNLLPPHFISGVVGEGLVTMRVNWGCHSVTVDPPGDPGGVSVIRYDKLESMTHTGKRECSTTYFSFRGGGY